MLGAPLILQGVNSLGPIGKALGMRSSSIAVGTVGWEPPRSSLTLDKPSIFLPEAVRFVVRFCNARNPCSARCPNPSSSACSVVNLRR